MSSVTITALSVNSYRILDWGFEDQRARLQVPEMRNGVWSLGYGLWGGFLLTRAGSWKKASAKFGFFLEISHWYILTRSVGHHYMHLCVSLFMLPHCNVLCELRLMCNGILVFHRFLVIFTLLFTIVGLSLRPVWAELAQNLLFVAIVF